MNYRRLATIAVGTAIVVDGVVMIRHTVREERAKRRQIQIDRDLDLAAIKRAADRTVHRINTRPELPTLAQLTEDMRFDIEFEKIAIRTEK